MGFNSAFKGFNRGGDHLKVLKVYLLRKLRILTFCFLGGIYKMPRSVFNNSVPTLERSIFLTRSEDMIHLLRTLDSLY